MNIAAWKLIAPKLAVLMGFMLAGGLLSAYFGKDLSWDIANYHYYNPFAFFHHRDQLDFWPTSFIHQYLNPAIDFLSYFLITYCSPLCAEFILGAIHAINAWLIFLIARMVLPSSAHISISVLLALLGMCGPVVLPGIGSFSNDNFVSLFVLMFVLFQLKLLKTQLFDAGWIRRTLRAVIHPPHHQWVDYGAKSAPNPPYAAPTPHAKWLSGFSGLSLGIGLGFKLTAGIFIVSGLVTLLILPLSLHARLRNIFYWGCGVIIGFLCIAGYWMAIEWTKYHNPLFPFFNGLFHSTQFAASNWRDTRFLPRGWMQNLFYPWYFSSHGNLIADAYFRDFRFLMAYVLLVVVGVKTLLGLTKSAPAHPEAASLRHLEGLNLLHTWLFVFVISSYIVWQTYFSMARYLAPIEMLIPLVIYLCVQKIFSSTASSILTSALFFFMLTAMIPLQMVRVPWYDTSYFNITLPDLTSTPQASVLIPYPAYAADLEPRPQAYLIPFLPAQWRAIGIPFWHETYLADTATSAAIYKQLAAAGDHPLYLLTSAYAMPELHQVAARFNLMPSGQCELITSDRQRVAIYPVLLCAVRKR